MDYQVSARKFRPGAFEELIGQGHVVQTLRNAILRRQVAHAYLFSGMRGVGKTTAARILAKALNCETGPTAEPCGRCASCEEITHGNSVDVIEIDGASNTGVDNVRELRDNVKFSPFRGAYRIYIIDEVHMLSNSAFNALLKTLEEPPAHAVFVFATTESHKIPATITSRCQHFAFRRIPRREIIARLHVVAQHTGVTISERSMGVIAGASEGSLRDALSLLDQAVAFGGAAVQDRDVDDMIGAVPEELVARLMAAVVKQDPAAAVELVGEASAQGCDLRAYCGAVVERVRHLMIVAVVPGVEQARGLLDMPGDVVEQMLKDADVFSVEQLQDVFQIFTQTEDRLRTTARPRFVFEAAAVRAARLLHSRAAGQPPVPAPVSHTPGEKPPPATTASRPPSTAPVLQSAASVLPAAPPAGPAPPPASPRAQPPAGPPAQAGALQREDWQRVVDAVKEKHPNIGSFLERGALVNADRGQVIVGFPTTESVACARIQKEEHRAAIERVCRDVTGAAVRLRVVEVEATGEQGTGAARQQAQPREQDEAALLNEARANPMVKQAMDLFGGEVVKASRMGNKKEA